MLRRLSARYSTAASALALLLLAQSAVAQPLVQREAGLWEIKTSQDSPQVAAMQGMQAALQNMPAAQRKQMEQVMQESGVSLTEPTVIKQCLTPEMAKRAFEPAIDDADMQCTNNLRTISATEASFSFTCNNADGQWQGKGRIWDATPRSYQSEMTMQGKVQGQPIKMSMRHQARWQGKDCKGLKPLG